MGGYVILREQEGCRWLEFEMLAQEKRLVHGVVLRDARAQVFPEESVKKLNSGDFVSGLQVHGSRVVFVKDRNCQAGECDGLITAQLGLALRVKHADCQAAIFYDPVHVAVGTVHSGWRGNVKNIYRATIEGMQREFGSKPQDLLVGISPSLGPKHAEFKHYKEEFPEEFWAFQVEPNYFDLWAIAEHQLQKCGVLPHHIEIARMCTYENVQDCFSYRRDKVKSGHVTFARLYQSPGL